MGTGRVFINEIQVANVDMFLDHSFNYGSWTELYNPTDDTLSLVGMKLRHTSADGTVKQQTLTAQHGKLLPHGFGVLWFDHNSGQGNYGGKANLQLPFKMDAEGGTVELYDVGYQLLDAVSYPPAVTRCSYARTTDGGTDWGMTSMPSPARTNSASAFAEERLPMPQPDVEGGPFRQPFSFHVTIPQGTTLHYTTDGSTPVPGKSTVSAKGIFTVSETILYRFLLTREGYLNSPVATRSFIRMDREYYLPILSVTTHPDNLFSDSIGLYVGGVNGKSGNNKSKPMNQNMDWERPVNVEYFVPEGTSGCWQTAMNQAALFSIFGGWTRFNDGDENFQYKPSFKLKADKLCEGLNFYPYPVFAAKPYIKNKTLLVRNGGQDQHGRIWDAAIQELLSSSGIYLDCQATQPAHIFLDGLYLGMFNLREASNRDFAYSNYGIGNDEVDQWENEFLIKKGSSETFYAWHTLTQQLVRNQQDETVWQDICRIVDVDEYCNYMAAEIYMGNLDWLRGSLKNIKGFRCRKDDGKIHVVVFDLDGCFGDTDMIKQIYEKGNGRLVEIFKNMMTYPPFRQQFVDTYCLLGGSVFLPERCIPIIREMEARTAPALAWEGNEPHTRADKLCAVLTNREGQHDKRIASLRDKLQLSDERRVSIDATTPLARILLNGREIPTTHFSGTLFGETVLKAVIPEGYELEGWQIDGATVSTDTVFDLAAFPTQDRHITLALRPSTPLSPIRINEVSSVNDIFINDYQKKSDWIELYNTTDKPVSISDAFLTDNPLKPQKYQITTPTGATDLLTLPPYGFRIVWCDGREPLSQLHTTFKLENADSAYICIRAADGSWADSLRYHQQGRWQSYGRFPDGTDHFALLDRITISETNHINTHTQLYSPDMETPLRPIPLPRHRQIAAIQYYNLNGQRIHSPTATTSLYIRRIVYDDGTMESRKVKNGK